jgi:hypothetical protein
VIVAPAVVSSAQLAVADTPAVTWSRSGGERNVAEGLAGADHMAIGSY